MWVPDFGAAGQRKLKNASVLISRCGGLGSYVAYGLASAGVGRLVLAHAGNLKPADLNRQILMTADWLGKPRVECAARRLKELKPDLEVLAIGENMCAANAERIVGEADLVVDCAPIFEERFAMNAACVRQRKPLIECSMYEFECQITTVRPGKTPCLACLHPQKPEAWKRQFPVFGAVAGTVGCLGAAEAIKVLSGVGEPLYGRMLRGDLRAMAFRTFKLKRDPACKVCGGIGG
ncbi:MAG: HesA/MoeB/ThiF family protein [Planctomycetes bacterium]|nr:HesA/MoeB/ThiF family protein [Planctomycetota bacterium]